MNINNRFKEILLDNQIIKNVSYDKAVKKVQELEQSFLMGSKVGLYGVGIEAEGLLRFLSKHTDSLKINRCFDRTIRSFEFKDMIQDNAVYPIEKIRYENIDAVIIGSYAYRGDFIKNLSALGYQGKIVDLYSDMTEYREELYTDYKKVYWAKQAYLKAEDDSKISALQQLIKQYLLLKDFESAFHYMDFYMNNKYPEYKRYMATEEAVKQLLKEIKKYMDARNKRDILINWVDALSYYDLSQFPFLHRKSEEGIWFQNAYTVIPWTTETTKTILFGEYPIEGKLFLRNELSADNVKLLKLLEEYGYQFVFCGMPKLAKLFGDDVKAPVSYFENKYYSSIQKQWDALAAICKNESPVCVLIHTLRETHQPYICGECDTLHQFGSTEKDWEQKECRNQAAISGKYINKQLEFYEGLYPEDAIKIYMSDHGRVGNNPMNEKKIHILLSVTGRGIAPVSVNGLFSLVRFPDLIKMLMDESDNWSALESEYIVIENLDAYSGEIVKHTLEGKLKREDMCQCKGIVTKTDAYYKYASGQEYYLKKDETGEYQIERVEFDVRIEELKKLCEWQFIDIYAYDKFKLSRLLY